MTTLDPVCAVVNFISLKASPLSHSSHISHAVSSLVAVDNDVAVVSSSGESVPANGSLLSLASPFLRDLLACAPCCTSPTILLPDISTRALKHLVSIVTNGFTTSHLGNGVFRDINQVIDTAKLLEIAIADLSYERSDFEFENQGIVDDQHDSTSNANKQIDIKLESFDELDQQMPVIASCKSLKIDQDFINDKSIIELSEKDNLGHSFTPLLKATKSEVFQKNIIHSSQDLFPCEECGKEFRSMRELKMHQVSHRNISLSDLNVNHRVSSMEDSKKFTCSICKRAFAKKFNLKQHMNIHTGTKPFKCDSCGKGFNAKSKKNNHAIKCALRKVDAESNNEVKYKEFDLEHMSVKRNKVIGQEILTVKNKVHETKYDSFDIQPNNEREKFDNSCNTCRKRFPNRNSFDEHLKDGCEKPYQCPYCPTKFLHASNMKRHTKKKHPNESYTVPSEKPHQCPYCPTKFSQAQNIKKHVKNKHSSEHFKTTEGSRVVAQNKKISKYSLFNHKCCSCSKVFLKEKYMKIHMKQCQVRSTDKGEDKDKEDHDSSKSKEKAVDSTSKKMPVTADVGINDCRKFKCPFCSEEFKHREDWDWHIDIYHDTSNVE